MDREYEEMFGGVRRFRVFIETYVEAEDMAEAEVEAGKIAQEIGGYVTELTEDE